MTSPSKSSETEQGSLAGFGFSFFSQPPGDLYSARISAFPESRGLASGRESLILKPPSWEELAEV